MSVGDIENCRADRFDLSPSGSESSRREATNRAARWRNPTFSGYVSRKVSKIQRLECTNGQISSSCERYSTSLGIFRWYSRERTLQSCSVEKGACSLPVRPRCAVTQAQTVPAFVLLEMLHCRPYFILQQADKNRERKEQDAKMQMESVFVRVSSSIFRCC